MSSAAIPFDSTFETSGARGGVRQLLRLEGLVLLALAAFLYAREGQSWTLFAILFLTPDLSFLGYLAGPRVGAFAYNGAHSTIGPLALLGAGLALNTPLAVAIAAIWLGHVGFDRALGYGLKYASGFSNTHLGRIGRKRS